MSSGIAALAPVAGVNSVIWGDQNSHRVAALPQGGYVVVWVNQDGQGEGLGASADNAASEIRMRLFDAQGRAASQEIAVNAATRGWQQDPRVAVQGDGSIAVTWTDGWDFFGFADHPGSLGVGGAGGDGLGKAVKLQLFSSTGVPRGGEVRVNTTVSNDQQAASVTALKGAGFLVAWEDGSTTISSTGAGGGPSIKAQTYTASGTAAGSEQAWAGDWCYAPQAVALAQGGHAALHLAAYYYDPASIVVRLHDAQGSVLGPQTTLPIGGQGAGAQWTCAALNNGGLVVAWTHRDAATGDGAGTGVMARVIGPDGVPRDASFVLSAVTVADQQNVRVAALDDGGFVAAWQSYTAPDSSGNWTIQLRAQAFDANGTRRGAEQVVEASDPSLQLGDLVGLAGGGYVVGWTGQSWIDTYARAYGPGLTPLGDAQVVHGSGGYQSAVDLVALADGRFAATWAAGSDGYSGGDGIATGLQTRVFVTHGATTTGTGSADRLEGTPLDDRLDGGAGNDLLISGGGNDVLTGGAGTDTLLLATTTADVLAHPADLRFVPGTVTAVGSSLGKATLDGIERVRLDDGLYAFDTLGPTGSGTGTSAGGEAWQAAALYRAAFGAMPGPQDLSRWTAQADQRDGMAALATAMIAYYVPGGVPTAVLAMHLYQVLVGSPLAPAAANDLAAQVRPGGTWATQGELVAWAAGLSLNTEHMVDLAGQPFAGSIQLLDAAYFS